MVSTLVSSLVNGGGGGILFVLVENSAFQASNFCTCSFVRVVLIEIGSGVDFIGAVLVPIWVS